MSIEQINSAAFDYDMLLATIEGAYIGKSNITISEYDSTAAPVVKVGSKFEVNGALFKVLTGDESPSGYSGISNSTQFYLMYDVSGEEFVFTSVSPTWNDALQGWYESGQTDRYFFRMYKDSGGTLYQNKLLLLSQNNFYTSGKYVSVGGHQVHGNIRGTVTHDVIFDTMAPAIPNVDDIMLITGCNIEQYDNGFVIIDRAERTASNVITLYIMNSFNGALGTLTFTNGDTGTSKSLMISW